MAAAIGLDLDAAAAALGRVEAVPGRMQRIDEGQPFSVVVDYAHTADALGKVLDELRPADAVAGLIAVFGSAGERDVDKRAHMGRVAGERCRLVVLTDEDPRGEDRLAILEAIAVGAEDGGTAPRPGPPARARTVPRPSPWPSRALAREMPCCWPARATRRTIETASGEIPWDEAAVVRSTLRTLVG